MQGATIKIDTQNMLKIFVFQANKIYATPRLCQFCQYTDCLIFLFVFAKRTFDQNYTSKFDTKCTKAHIINTIYFPQTDSHHNNVQHKTRKVKMKRSAIRCIPVPSHTAYVNLFLRYRMLCIAPTNISTERLYGWKGIQGNILECLKPAGDAEKV
jgi:hypothetical protein